MNSPDIPAGYILTVATIIIFTGIYLCINQLQIIDPEGRFGWIVNNMLTIITASIFLIASIAGASRIKDLDAFGCSVMTVCALSFLIAEVVWVWYDVFFGIDVPYPSTADMFYIIGTIALFISIYTVAQGISRNDQMTIWLLLFGIAVMILVAYAYMRFTDMLDTTIDFKTFLSLLYPALDVACLIMLINLLIKRIRTPMKEAVVIMMIATSLLLIGDVYFAITESLSVYYAGSMPDLLYSLSYALMAIGVVRCSYFEWLEALKHKQICGVLQSTCNG